MGGFSKIFKKIGKSPMAKSFGKMFEGVITKTHGVVGGLAGAVLDKVPGVAGGVLGAFGAPVGDLSGATQYIDDIVGAPVANAGTGMSNLQPVAPPTNKWILPVAIGGGVLVFGTIGFLLLRRK